MKQLSLKTINSSSPYDVMMVNPNTYRFVTDYSVEIAISFDLDDLLEHGEAYMFNITNVNRQRSPRDMKVRDTVIAIIDNFFETNEFALLYICETGDRKQAMRNRLFDSWFAYANDKEQYVIMVANIQDLEGVDNYAAMILRKDNPYFVDYVSEFNNTVKYVYVETRTLTRQSQSASCSKAVPSRITMARALMPRQPYSVAVPSTGGRLHPRFLRKRGLGRKWSSLWLKGDGGIRKTPHSSDDKCRAILQ